MNVPFLRALAVACLAALAVVVAVAPAADAQQILRGWGDGNGLGIDSTTSPAKPVAIPNAPADVDAVAVGLERTLVLTSDGVLTTGITGSWASSGPLHGLGPDENVDSARTLTPIPNTADVIAVSSGDDSSLLLREDGTVWAFGRNQFGSAGAPQSVPQTATPGSRVFVPTQVKKEDGTPLAGIVAIASSGQHSLALDGDGDVWAWGNHLRLGNADAVTGGTATAHIPHKVELPGPVAQIAAGNEHSLALLDDGRVFGWGVNTNGQLGNGTNVTPPDRLPVQVQGLDGLEIKSIAAGWKFSLALLEDGTHRGWGQNALGELGLGLGVTANQTTAVARNPLAPAPPPFDQLVAGRQGAYAITSTASRQVYAWGYQGGADTRLGGIALNPFPFGSGNAITATSNTEIPQRVGNLSGVPALAVGGTAQHQIVLSEPTLRSYDDVTSPFFFSQQVGTTSSVRAQAVVASGAAAVINRVYLAGPHAEDFHFVRGELGVTDPHYAFPVPLPQAGVFSVRLQFTPTGVGVRTARVVFEAEDETVFIDLEGFGVALTGGPRGERGERGEKGEKGETASAPAGVVAFAARAAKVKVKRGRKAVLSFLVVNGTASRLTGATVTPAPPKALRAKRARKATRVAALAAGRAREVRVPVAVGRRARLGVHRVRVTFKAGAKTVTRTVRVRVTR